MELNQGVSEVTFLEALWKNWFLISSDYWWLQALHGLWPHHSNLFLPGHKTFPFSGSSLCCPLKSTGVIAITSFSIENL